MSISPPSVAGAIQRAEDFSTGSIAVATTTTVTLTWATAMPSADYAVNVTLEDSTGDMRLIGVSSHTATQVVVRVQNMNAISARTGTLHLLGTLA